MPKDDFEDDWADVRPPREERGAPWTEEILKKVAAEVSGKDHPDIPEIPPPNQLRDEVLSPGGIIVTGSTMEVGPMPVRQEMTVLPADTPRREIGWMVHEMTDEELRERDSPENLARLEAERNAPAGHYNSSRGYTYEPSERMGWTSIPVLQNLWGTPWNTAAENFLRCLRPSVVRVVGFRQGVTLDAVTWRVTVYLGEGDVNIERIEQEVEVGLTGFRNGHDASCYLSGTHSSLNAPQPTAVFNPRGITRLRLSRDDD